MKMENAKLMAIVFDSADVIATSGLFDPESVIDGEIFYFYGLGNDKVAQQNGNPLLIQYSGKDVTKYYYDNSEIFSSDSHGLFIYEADEDYTSEALAVNQIEDGAYSLGHNKSNPTFTRIQ